MPYIDQAARDALALSVPPGDAGALNYAITRMVAQFIGRRGLRYAAINEAIGVLECAKLELYRRIAAPYEDEKLTAHGDVYDPLIPRRPDDGPPPV